MTVRQLVWASEGLQEELWNHTSHILAELRNDMTVGRKITARELNPFSRNKKEAIPRISDPRLMALEDGLEVFTVQ